MYGLSLMELNELAICPGTPNTGTRDRPIPSVTTEMYGRGGKKHCFRNLLCPILIVASGAQLELCALVLYFF